MGHPWGLSDADFLGIYGAGIAAMVLLPVAFWGVIRHAPDRRRARQLDPYRTGYLAGGPQRLAEVIIAAHVESGALRVDSKGRLSKAGPAVASWPYAAVGLPDGLSTAAARKWIKSDPSTANIARSLQAQGLLIPESRVAALRLTTVAGLAVLLAAGVVLLAEAATGYLVLLFVLSIVIGFAVYIFLLDSPPRVTRLGAAYLRQLRAVHKARGLVASESVSGAAVGSRNHLPVAADASGAALSGVALLGFSGMRDETLRSALIAGLSSSKQSSGSSSKRSSSSSSKRSSASSSKPSSSSSSKRSSGSSYTSSGADGGGSSGGGGHGCGGHGCGGHGCY